MPWSNNWSSRSSSAQSKGVLSKERAEKTVLEFTPPRFDLGPPGQAIAYLKEKIAGSDFRMNNSIRIQTGVDKIEEANKAELIEIAALEKLKEIQEGAYKEAYGLGLDEGKNDAFTKFSNELQESVDGLSRLTTQLGELKSELLSHNEAHLLKLVFQMASRLARQEVTQNSETVLQVLRDAVALSQDEENIMVRVAPEQFEFLEKLKKQSGREIDFLKKMKFEPDPEISVGGCVVETNYGEVDARLEQRIEQLWTALSENIPKIKDKVAS